MSSGFLIAAPQSGSGKTTIALAVMAAFSRRGLKVAPFKCGPDFIDPGYHRLITGQPSINLDGWMCPAEFVRKTFHLHAAGAHVAVIEGVMGLFDGIGTSALEGSSAQIAAITGAPVVLVVNARGMAASAAALVKGFVGFEPRVRVVGVIFNNVGSDSHAELLRQTLHNVLPDVAVLGCVPRDETLAIPSRHLGLVTAEEQPFPAGFVDQLAELAEEYLHLDRLAALNLNPVVPEYTIMFVRNDRLLLRIEAPVRIAVARDAAFCFCYEDNLRLLREAGAEIVFFSPLTDSGLPHDIAGIYLPGGYPELHAGQLAANVRMKHAIREAVQDDMPVYAECGGLIYLTEGLEGSGEFASVFPVRARMLPKRKALGYRQVNFTDNACIAKAGTVARGHEFHYSEISAMPESVQRCYQVSRQGKTLAGEGYLHRNCLASYIHLHFGSCPAMAPGFVAACRSYAGVLQNH